MGGLKSLELTVTLLLVQVFTAAFCEGDGPCQPGLISELEIFRVNRTHGHTVKILGQVNISDCNGQKRAQIHVEDAHLNVDQDGTIRLMRAVTARDQHDSFLIHALDSRGNKFSARVRVKHEPTIHQHPNNHDDHHRPYEVASVIHGQSSGSLKRRKRDWVIPPINFPENDRGPFPKAMVQIRSSNDKSVKMEYSISGAGADQPPKGLFTIDRNSGVLYVTQPLDREKQSQYMLEAHAIAVGKGIEELPLEVIVKVIDQNDNKPEFTQDPFLGSVAETAPPDFEIVKISATDADESGSLNADIKYSILSQEPQLPNANMFSINPVSGMIRLSSSGLDREKLAKYTLVIQAADLNGDGLMNTCSAIITVTDSNDNAPQFENALYTVSVPENKVGAVVVKMPVTDNDEPHTPAWSTRYKIIQGNHGGFFNVSTGPNKVEGIITTVKGLDFEKNMKYTLLVTVENDVPFATRLPTSTATVIVNVEDENEAPIFNPVKKIIVKSEDMAVDSELTQYTATDPDTAKKQTVRYQIERDRAGWLNISKDTGLITVKSPMDRESAFYEDGVYEAIILAIDSDEIPATGTGTLLIELQDVNDNAPTINENSFSICNEDSQPVLLSIADRDGPGYTAPFRVDLQGTSKKNWTAKMNDTRTGILLTLRTRLEEDNYRVVLKVYDSHGLAQESTVLATVCNCKGQSVACGGKIASVWFPGILGILGAVLFLLLLLLLLLLFLRRRRSVKEEPLLQEDDVRDNIYFYDEEGGGEEDQDYDLSQLHRGLDNRPDVYRNDVAPTYMIAPEYRPRPANPEDIGNFIDDNLKAADSDPTAPPYDSLLVFDYEGGGSDAGSLSSLNSSSSGEDQDYDYLNEWGPRFKKLADMYGADDD
ncbi:B-cadherin-like [Megalops cyprinoides]|uniref:B-cadherin-like n=1 Tax=Megalops cyprinoides TaxID=118141 RepID=UPI00186459CB|nr:B-cadherin-like [Megalops cyprinoides]